MVVRRWLSMQSNAGGKIFIIFSSILWLSRDKPFVNGGGISGPGENHHLTPTCPQVTGNFLTCPGQDSKFNPRQW